MTEQRPTITLLMARTEQALTAISEILVKQGEAVADHAAIEALKTQVKTLDESLKHLQELLVDSADKPSILTRLLFIEKEIRDIKKYCEHCPLTENIEEISTALRTYIEKHNQCQASKHIIENKVDTLTDDLNARQGLLDDIRNWGWRAIGAVFITGIGGLSLWFTGIFKDGFLRWLKTFLMGVS